MSTSLPPKTPIKAIWQQPDWPNFKVQGLRVQDALLRARKKQGEVIGQANAIGMQGAQELIQSRYIQEIIATSAIEGENLNLDSVRSSVFRKLGVALANDLAPLDKKVDGLVDILQDALESRGHDLSAEKLFQWHQALFPGKINARSPIKVGSFRDHEDPMQIISGRQGKEIVHYTAPPSSSVAGEITVFLDWFNQTRPNHFPDATSKKQSATLDGLARAAIAHLWFETIHPFEDGNGRLGRAIVEMAMAQDAQSGEKLYSLSEQMMANRSSYYDALNAAQHGNLDISEWVIWFANTCELACEASCEVMKKAIERSHYWAQYSHVQLNDRQKKVIHRLLDEGDGGFLGGLNAEKYMKITASSKATATRDLSDLLESKMLFSVGQGKALRYYIHVASWTHGLE
jgi:Fic family protein